MREIKFRGKNAKGEWIIGDLLHNRGETFIAPPGIANTLDTLDDFRVYPATVGQYTGMEDRNGKEIYEGDIILQQGYHGGNEKMVVRFEHGAFIVGYHNGSSTIKRPMLINKKCKTLGNIYDNPELLEVD